MKKFTFLISFLFALTLSSTAKDRPHSTIEKEKITVMKTGFTAVDVIFDKLKSGTLVSEINGEIYKDRRAANSIKEDVVINCITLNNTQLQQGVVNVNIHVPNLSIKKNKVIDDSQPDRSRLNALANIALDDLTETYGTDYNFNVQQAPLLIRDESGGDHYVNIRLDFFAINILN